MGKITDQILTDIKEGTSRESDIPFVGSKEKLHELQKLQLDIDAKFPSRNKFSDACAISASQLSSFFNGEKSFGRDRLLAIFISLDYGFERIQALLHLFQVSELYPRNQRDYQIIVGIKDQLSLHDIDELLVSKGLESLSQYSNNKGI